MSRKNKPAPQEPVVIDVSKPQTCPCDNCAVDGNCPLQTGTDRTDLISCTAQEEKG